MQEEFTEEEAGRKSFLGWIKSMFGRGNEEEEEPETPHYKRKLLDGRIEKYLDQNLDAYITEYGILTGLDIEGYEIRYTKLTGRIASMKDYVLSADARISDMERDILLVQKAVKGGK